MRIRTVEIPALFLFQFLFLFLFLFSTIFHASEVCASGLCALEPSGASQETEARGVRVSFARGAWNAEEWQTVRSPRWEDICGRWIQEEDRIVNDVPEGKTEEELLSAPEAYASMLWKKPFHGDGVFRIRCSFDYRMAPLLVLSEEIGPVYREHLEIVVFDGGLNLWRHYFRDGKPSWKRLGRLEMNLAAKTVHELCVKLERREAGVFLTMSVNGESATCALEEGWPTEYYAGITACEGRNAFYEFTAEGAAVRK